jgi:hypothetical protein
MKEKVKIISFDNGKTRIFIDGKEITGLEYTKFEQSVGGTPVLDISVLTPIVKVDGDGWVHYERNKVVVY